MHACLFFAIVHKDEISGSHMQSIRNIHVHVLPANIRNMIPAPVIIISSGITVILAGMMKTL